jgi:hypothetical protein
MKTFLVDVVRPHAGNLQSNIQMANKFKKTIKNYHSSLPPASFRVFNTKTDSNPFLNIFQLFMFQLHTAKIHSKLIWVL